MKWNYETTCIPHHFLYSISENNRTIFKPPSLAKSAYFHCVACFYLRGITRGRCKGMGWHRPILVDMQSTIDRWVINGYFFQLPHFFHLDMNYPINTWRFANPNRGHSHFPRNFWSSYENIFRSEDAHAY